MVSMWINLGGEFDEDRSDVTQFTTSNPQLADLMSLGEYLATEGEFVCEENQIRAELRHVERKRRILRYQIYLCHL